MNEQTQNNPLQTDFDLDTIRHSCAHLMAQAVKELFPETQVTIGPVIEDGFYYDFYRDTPFVPEDLKKIEKRMKELAKKGLDIKRQEMPRDEAVKFFKNLGEDFKVEIIESIDQADAISAYTQGEFTDLCRGPHVDNTKRLKAFKLLSTSAAYWRGDERNPVLQRIYGTAWRNKDELKEYLDRLEEAKRRDHRKLGKELDLFSMSEDVGPGLILWHPKGSRIRYIVEEFWRQEHYKNGYELVYTPHTAKSDLWQTSGHFDFYKENMFAPMDVENKEYILKPMNCPFHIQIYKSHLRSYRDLPLRWAELGTVYRYERSGVMHGLLRVRGFTQDDAHLFCARNQIESEIERVLEFVLYILRSFGFDQYKVFLSTRPEKSVGSDDDWATATSALQKALDKSGLDYEEDPGEGVFYGPKIDIKIKDSLGRFWQVSTIQVDFNLPHRFEMSYVAEDGKYHQPIMIHRALMGSIERFFGCLIEHYAGAFPLWLAPVQVALLPITDNQNAYAEQVAAKLEESGIRVEKDLRNEKIGFKIREAQLAKTPYMLVLGDKEVQSGQVAVRKRRSQDTHTLSLDDFLKQLKHEIDTKAIDVL
ncbi:threonine--tRNA ligase [Nitrospina gracilis]|uniref:threonine--tRNA ligase n=1 Tax=Nitrospina gracilis TaxID=35801 RepID=UPI001F01BB35|nr:threonine--tRNA ligase [Nitrospina gracilis]MCF8719122.1 threonyl-tRNA synthetase [Nitrospina gracilis Nb-211]